MSVEFLPIDPYAKELMRVGMTRFTISSTPKGKQLETDEQVIAEGDTVQELVNVLPNGAQVEVIPAIPVRFKIVNRWSKSGTSYFTLERSWPLPCGFSGPRYKLYNVTGGFQSIAGAEHVQDLIDRLPNGATVEVIP